MTREEIDKAVKERLRIANERLSKKNGVDPTNKRYIQRKQDVIYASKHGIPYAKVKLHKQGKYVKEEFHPTVAELEKRLHRPLNNVRPTSMTSTGKAVRDVLTGKRYDSVGQLARELDMYWTTVRKWIEEKRLFPNNTYYEFI